VKAALVASTVLLGSLLGAPVATAGAADAEPSPRSAAASGGMDSPDAAVEELLASVRASDPLGLLAVLHPDERFLVDTLYTNSTGSAEAAGALDVDALLQALHVDVTTEALVVEPVNDHVAWVTTAAAEVTASLDVAQLDSAVTADVSGWEQADPYTGQFEPQFDDLGVAVINDGGRWFVSALYTSAEIARRHMEVPASPASATPAATVAATPEDAVRALTAAVSAEGWVAAAGTLTPFESGLVSDYSTSIGGELTDTIAGYTLRVEPTRLRVVDQGEGWAIVESDAWTFGVSGTGDDPDDRIDTTLTVDGLCGELRDWDAWDEEYETSKGCAFEDDSVFNVFETLADAGWRGPRFVVVNREGTWSVSLLQTVLQSTAPFTTDIDTFAGIAEFVAQLFLDDGDDFYPAAISLLAAPLPPLGPGTSTVTPRAGGEFALFRVPAGATVEVAVPPGEYDECFVVVIDEDEGDIVDGTPCDEPVEPISAPATLLVTTSQMAFASIYDLGDIQVTVS
jgi:hypothetical protein